MKGQENFRQNTEASGPEAETSGREAGDFEKETKDCLRRSGILLAGRDYTCSRMREKLLSYGFAEDVVGKTLEDLQSAHYLDDVRFAENFVRAHREDRSRRRIRMDLEIKAKQKVDADAAYLFRMIEQVRKSLGYTETIQEAMLRLQASAGRYRALLAGHYEEEV